MVIVDGIMGDLDFEEGGNPVQMDMVLAGRDPFWWIHMWLGCWAMHQKR